MFSCEFCEISKNTFFYRTPLVVASALANFEQYYSSTFAAAIGMSFEVVERHVTEFEFLVNPVCLKEFKVNNELRQ